MSFYRLRSIAGAAWPRLPGPDQSLLWSAYQTLCQTQWLSAQEIERFQLEQLRVMLDHCSKQVPYYSRLFREHGFSVGSFDLDDFRRLPPLTRELYQANFDALTALNLPDGMIRTSESFTSGTSGVPLKVCKTNRVNLWWLAFTLRELEWMNVDLMGRMASIRLLAMSPEQLPALLAGVVMPYWSKDFDPLIATGLCYGMDIRQNPRAQLAWLHKTRPHYLISMPSNLEFLARLAEESGEKLPDLRLIQALGETLSDEARRQIEQGFGVPVKNTYSTTEAGYIASECPEGHGLHVHSENALVEVIDAENRPCKPGETGRLVFTTLHNFFAPFVRYEIQDDVTLADGPCPCGRGLPLWKSVEGRRIPLLNLASGGKKSSAGIVMGVRKVGGCHQFQIIQRAADHFILRIVPDTSWSAEHPERMRATIREEFGQTVRVDVQEYEYLERPAGGKLKIVFVESGDEEGLRERQLARHLA